MEREEELIKKFGIDIKKLGEEQKKLAKLVSEKDAMDYSNAQFIGGIDATTTGKRVISSAIILDSAGEIIEQTSSLKRVSFPYIPGFLSYRRLPALIEAYKKLEAKPDIIFINGHGVSHPRGCGLASHFGLATDTATIGIAKGLLLGEAKKDKVYIKGKVKAALVETKQGSKPIIVSVGHKVSLATAVELTKKFTEQPHKFPEPLNLAHKYANKIKKELTD